MSKYIQLILAASVALAASTMLAAPSAHASDLSVGAKIGGNFSLLSKPTDPAGEPTLLRGSAFTDYGLALGATGYYPLAEIDGAVFELETGLLLSWNKGQGHEKHRDTGEERIITLTTTLLRVPVLVFLRDAAPTSGFRVGLGLEPMFGLKSGASVEHRNSSVPPEELHTTPTNQLGMAFALGFDWRATPAWSIPLELRATWAPFVPGSTKERFENFESMEDPGEYGVAFDWQVMLMTGVRYDL
jgi:hypothetical protein